MSMGPLNIQQGTDSNNNSGAWVNFVPGQAPVFVAKTHWVGFDFDGTISRNVIKEYTKPPYSLGEAVPEMIATAKSLLEAGITIKVFTARARDPLSIPSIQDWTERHGLGRLEVTDRKDFDLIRFFDDRAIPVPASDSLCNGINKNERLNIQTSSKSSSW